MVSQQQVKMEICISLNIKYTLEQTSKQWDNLLQLVLKEADHTLWSILLHHQSQQELRETDQAHKSDSFILWGRMHFFDSLLWTTPLSYLLKNIYLFQEVGGEMEYY